MARKYARSGLMLRRLDRLPLRSSGRIHGDPVELILDRFAMRSQELRCEHPGYAATSYQLCAGQPFGVRLGRLLVA